MIDFTRKGGQTYTHKRPRQFQSQQPLGWAPQPTPPKPMQPSIPPGERPAPPGQLPGRPPGPSIPPGERPAPPGQIPPGRGGFAGAYGPQIEQIEARFPGFAEQARAAWQQRRQEAGGGWWRNYMNPQQGAQQNWPGFMEMFQSLMGRQLPNRWMQYAQRRGWY